MRTISSILVPLDGSERSAKPLGSAVWLADTLNAQLHLLRATSEYLPAQKALADLRIPRRYWSQITLHQSKSYAEKAIIDAVNDLQIDLVAMSTKGEGGRDDASGMDPLGHVTRSILGDCDVPVLLMPSCFEENLPWRSVLVPISGESEADQVLRLAIHLAQPLKLSVHLAHVVDDGRYGYLAETEYADSPFHEYAGRLGELVNRATLLCSPAECRCLVEDVALCRGDIAEELTKVIKERNIDLLAVGWHGQLAAKRAAVLKQLLSKVTTPVLLVKAGAPPKFEFKVGEALE